MQLNVACVYIYSQGTVRRRVKHSIVHAHGISEGHASEAVNLRISSAEYIYIGLSN